MGNLLPGPVTWKDSGDAESMQSGLAWAYSGMQGWRDRMEDAHLAIESVGAVSSSSPGWRQTALFGVMDGHGGEQVAQFCQRHFPHELAKHNARDPAAALTSTFHCMDELLSDPNNLDELQSLTNDTVSFKSWSVSPHTTGCTAVMACVRGDSIVVANAGDSRAVLCRRGRAIDMSDDHKPNLPHEMTRIQRAGGSVMEQRVGGHIHYRVNGNLNLSRSIGDLLYKQNTSLPPQEQLIICLPDVRHFKRQITDEFMIIACDGVWDVMSSQEACDFIRARLGDISELRHRLQDGSFKLSTILEEMLDSCLSPDLAQTMGLGGDNMTAVLVVFLDAQADQGGWLDSSEIHGSWMCPYR